MKAVATLIFVSLVPLAAKAADTDSFEKRLEALEYASYESTVSWNGFFESRFDSMKVDRDILDPTTGAVIEHEDGIINLHRWLLGVDFKAKPAPNLSFFGRFSASTLYNPGNGESENPIPSHLTGSRGYTNAVPRVERAFFNYSPVPNLVLTVGRLPTLDGPPTHLYDGLSRLGTYPKLIYAAVLDGYALTYNLALGDSQTLAIRYVNSPFSGTKPIVDGMSVSYEQTKADASIQQYERKSHDVVEIAGGMLDYTASGTGIARNVNLIVQYLGWKDFKLLGLKWDYSRVAFYLELEDIANLGLNFYAGSISTTNKSEGGLTVGATPTGDLIKIGLLSNSADSTVKGRGNLIGLGYRIPAAALKNPLIGVEAISTDRGYLIFDSTVREPFDYYGIRGKANQVYASFDLTTGLRLRIGQVSAAPDYLPGLVPGAPAETDNKFKTLYANFRLDY